MRDPNMGGRAERRGLRRVRPVSDKGEAHEQELVIWSG
jgi:hypothetical protein